MVNIDILWEKKGHRNFFPRKSGIFLENRKKYRMKSNISVTGFATPRLRTRLTPLFQGIIGWRLSIEVGGIYLRV